MSAGDLVKWTFSYAKVNSNNWRVVEQKFGILLYPQELPVGSWIVLLGDGRLMHADITELELISESG